MKSGLRFVGPLIFCVALLTIEAQAEGLGRVKCHPDSLPKAGDTVSVVLYGDTVLAGGDQLTVDLPRKPKSLTIIDTLRVVRLGILDETGLKRIELVVPDTNRTDTLKATLKNPAGVPARGDTIFAVCFDSMAANIARDSMVVTILEQEKEPTGPLVRVVIDKKAHVVAGATVRAQIPESDRGGFSLLKLLLLLGVLLVLLAPGFWLFDRLRPRRTSLKLDPKQSLFVGQNPSVGEHTLRFWDDGDLSLMFVECSDRVAEIELHAFVKEQNTAPIRLIPNDPKASRKLKATGGLLKKESSCTIGCSFVARNPDGLVGPVRVKVHLAFGRNGKVLAEDDWDVDLLTAPTYGSQPSPKPSWQAPTPSLTLADVRATVESALEPIRAEVRKLRDLIGVFPSPQPQVSGSSMSQRQDTEVLLLAMFNHWRDQGGSGENQDVLLRLADGHGLKASFMSVRNPLEALGNTAKKDIALEFHRERGNWFCAQDTGGRLFAIPFGGRKFTPQEHTLLDSMLISPGRERDPQLPVVMAVSAVEFSRGAREGTFRMVRKGKMLTEADEPPQSWPLPDALERLIAQPASSGYTLASLFSQLKQRLEGIEDKQKKLDERFRALDGSQNNNSERRVLEEIEGLRREINGVRKAQTTSVNAETQLQGFERDLKDLKTKVDQLMTRPNVQKQVEPPPQDAATNFEKENGQAVSEPSQPRREATEVEDYELIRAALERHWSRVLEQVGERASSIKKADYAERLALLQQALARHFGPGFKVARVHVKRMPQQQSLELTEVEGLEDLEIGFEHFLWIATGSGEGWLMIPPGRFLAASYPPVYQILVANQPASQVQDMLIPPEAAYLSQRGDRSYDIKRKLVLR